MMKETAYKEYLKLELANISNRHTNELYNNGWCVIEGRSFTSPHPHRHYTFEEFVYWLDWKEDLRDRFKMTH